MALFSQGLRHRPHAQAGEVVGVRTARAALELLHLGGDVPDRETGDRRRFDLGVALAHRAVTRATGLKDLFTARSVPSRFVLRDQRRRSQEETKRETRGRASLENRQSRHSCVQPF